MPYSLSEQQIDFILNDIRESGVTIEKLQINLLDHICCIMEEEMKEGEDFESKYQSIKKQAFENNLIEIEKETNNLLRFKHYYKMKRLLYILLFLSISYNVFVFSRLGYEYYTLRQWESQSKMFRQVTLKEGYEDFIEKLKEQNPEAAKKDFIYVSFTGPIWERHPLIDEDDYWAFTGRDSTEIKATELFRVRQIKQTDSLASIYNKNVCFVFAYQNPSKIVDDIIKKNKSESKNIVYIKDVPKLLRGYENNKKLVGTFLPTTFVLDKSGNLVYEFTIGGRIVNKKLVNFLKSTR